MSRHFFFFTSLIYSIAAMPASETAVMNLDAITELSAQNSSTEDISVVALESSIEALDEATQVISPLVALLSFWLYTF